MYVTQRYEEKSRTGTAGFVAGGVMIGVGLILGYKLLAGNVSVGGHALPPAAGLAVGLPLMLAGLALTGWQHGKVVDAAAHVAFRYWGFFRPWKRVVFPLAHYRYLTLEPLVGPGREGEENVLFTVAFFNEDDRGLAVFESPDYWTARREAVELSRMLQMPVHDRSSESEALLNPGDQYSSLRARLLGANLRPPYPPRPADSRVDLDILADEAELEVPRAGFNTFHRVVLAIGIAACAVTCIYLLGLWRARLASGDGRVGAVFETIVLVPLGLGFGAALIVHALRAAVRHEHVWVSPRGLTVERGGPLKSERQEFGVDDVEQVDVWHGYVRVLVRGTRPVLLGMTLTDEEREWMRDVIRHMITGRERGKGSTSFY